MNALYIILFWRKHLRSLRAELPVRCTGQLIAFVRLWRKECSCHPVLLSLVPSDGIVERSGVDCIEIALLQPFGRVIATRALVKVPAHHVRRVR